MHGSSRNLTPRNTARTNTYAVRVRELIFRLSRDVGLGRSCSNSLIASVTTTSRNLTPAPRAGKIVCKRVLFSTTARRVTSPIWGPLPCKQALRNVHSFETHVLSFCSAH